jgi:hypothetical protein
MIGTAKDETWTEVLTNIAPFSLWITEPLDSEMSNSVTLVYWQPSELYAKSIHKETEKSQYPEKNQMKTNPNTSIYDTQNVQQKLKYQVKYNVLRTHTRPFYKTW